MIKLLLLVLSAGLFIPARMPSKAPLLEHRAQAPVPAVVGAVVGEKVRGAPYAVWADADNDGLVDGYVANGAYVKGTPPGYQLALGRVAIATQAGQVPAASTTGVRRGFLKGAVIGAPVAAKPGAVWADINADGLVDGYVYKGQYYSGAPQRVPRHLP